MSHSQNEKRVKKQLVQKLEIEIDLLKSALVKRVLEAPDFEMATLSEFIPARNAARMIGVSMPTLRKYSKQGILTRYRIGSKIYYRRDEISQAFKKEKGEKMKDKRAMLNLSEETVQEIRQIAERLNENGRKWRRDNPKKWEYMLASGSLEGFYENENNQEE